MGALFGLLFLGFLFGGSSSSYHPKCPYIQQETKPIYKYEGGELYGITALGTEMIYKFEGTTYDEETGFSTRKFKTGGATTTFGGVKPTVVTKIGEEPDPEAIAFNKRVHECQTLNGEFNSK